MHAPGKGISSSALPYRRTPPSWLKISPEEVIDSICKFARKGLTPSQIGVLLRDAHGVNQVRGVTGNKVLRILKANGKKADNRFCWRRECYLNTREMELDEGIRGILLFLFWDLNRSDILLLSHSSSRLDIMASLSFHHVLFSCFEQTSA